MWGRGIYFAVNSSYSAGSYSYHDPVNNVKYLFYVRVMIGEAVKLPSNGQLKFPPLNPNKG